MFGRCCSVWRRLGCDRREADGLPDDSAHPPEFSEVYAGRATPDVGHGCLNHKAIISFSPPCRLIQCYAASHSSRYFLMATLASRTEISPIALTTERAKALGVPCFFLSARCPAVVASFGIEAITSAWSSLVARMACRIAASGITRSLELTAARFAVFFGIGVIGSFLCWLPSFPAAVSSVRSLGRIRLVQVFADGFWIRGPLEHRHCARLHPHQVGTPACWLATSAFPFAAMFHSCTRPFHGQRLYSQRGTRTNHPVRGILA